MTDRHAGAPEGTAKIATEKGWVCQYQEGGPPICPRHGIPHAAAWATGCHYCRIMRVGQTVNGGPDTIEVSGALAENLGVEENTTVAALDALRAACRIAGDDRLLVILARLEPIHPDKEPGEDHG